VIDTMTLCFGAILSADYFYRVAVGKSCRRAGGRLAPAAAPGRPAGRPPLYLRRPPSVPFPRQLHRPDSAAGRRREPVQSSLAASRASPLGSLVLAGCCGWRCILSV